MSYLHLTSRQLKREEKGLFGARDGSQRDKSFEVPVEDAIWRPMNPALFAALAEDPNKPSVTTGECEQLRRRYSPLSLPQGDADLESLIGLDLNAFLRSEPIISKIPWATWILERLSAAFSM